MSRKMSSRNARYILKPDGLFEKCHPRIAS